MISPGQTAHLDPFGAVGVPVPERPNMMTSPASKWSALVACILLGATSGCGKGSVDGEVAISPSAASVPPRGDQLFTAHGGSGGYTWSLVTSASGGTIGATTGAYHAGPIGGVTDVVAVVDGAGHQATATVVVAAGVSILPAIAAAPPRGTLTLAAAGGSGTGYTWVLRTNASGGRVDPTTGVYLAGSTGAVNDVVEVTDSLGNTAARSIAVGPGLAIDPAALAVAPRASQVLTATGGSGTGYTWAMVTDASGGTVGASTGAYQAGTAGDTTDVVRVTDSLGNTATRTITVGPQVKATPGFAGLPPRATLAFSASGGSGSYTWAFVTNGSGGTLVAATGLYTAGPTDAVDLLRVTDTLGNSATAEVTVTLDLRISGTGSSTAPRGQLTFTASGGSGTGYTWAIATNRSGATIGAATGLYTAGPTGGVTDVVRVTDSLGNGATHSVEVTAGLSISPATATVAPGATQAFTAVGGGAGLTWSLTTNASGGSIDPASGLYRAGPVGGVTDVVRVADALGNAATRDVAVTAGLSIAPASASLPPRGTRTFTASGGSGTGFGWDLATNASGGSINPTTGIYVAGATGGVTDVIRVTDSLGNTATRDVTVTAGLSVAPATATLGPGATRTFTASGGSGTGYAWAFATNGSGGTIGAATGLYTAGPTGGVTDVVRVTDSLGNTATADVTVVAAIVIAPALVSLEPGGTQAFTASGGSGTGYTWALDTNLSGGTIGASTGLYTAGPTGGVTDVVRVTDSLGGTATRDVTVSTGVILIAPATASVPPRGTQAFTASGGSGTGFGWALATNGSGGSIHPTTGLYTAGPTGGVTDVVRVTDSLGRTATRDVAVTAGVTVAPGSVALAPGGNQAFTASGGSGTGFTWALTSNGSGASLGAATGLYTAGPSSGVTDVVQVTDSLGNQATATVAVQGAVIQRWRAPTAWGGTATSFWPAEAALVQHATFGASGLPQEGGTAGVAWSQAGAGTVAHPAFGAFASPQVTRHGAGPFPATDTAVATDATRYQATAGDAALGLTGDLLACAVVRPDANPVSDGEARIILSKGSPDGNGWALVQRRHAFTFNYRGAASGAVQAIAFSHLPDQGGAIGAGPGDISYLVVCGGRAGNQLVVAANSFLDGGGTFSLAAGEAGVPATGVPATIGAAASGQGNSRFGGIVYETAVWSLPATAANLQAKMGAVLGLGLVDGTAVRYFRDHMGAFTGVDGLYHTGWRHSPRLDPARGLQFGFFGQNALIGTAAAGDVRPSALDAWTTSGTVAVTPNVRTQPGDSLADAADRIKLGPGASLATAMQAFSPVADGPIVEPLQGQIWVYLDTAAGDSVAGTLRVGTTQPAAGGGAAVDMGHFDVDLSTLAPNQWSRVFVPPNHLYTDVTQTAEGTLYLQNPGAADLQVTAWGVTMGRFGGARGLPVGYDPGFLMYDALLRSDAGEGLHLPHLTTSTAGQGFCIAVDAQPDTTLPWVTTFDDGRAFFQWSNGLPDAQEVSVRFVIGGDTSHSIGQGDLILRVRENNVNTYAQGTPPASWTAGTKHNVKACVSATGTMQIYADDQPLGNSATLGAQPVPDLSIGHLAVGADFNGNLAWYGSISQALVCRYDGDPTTCQ